jgi:hypothetical protein
MRGGVAVVTVRLRRGKIAGLRWDNVDIGSKTLKVAPTRLRFGKQIVVKVIRSRKRVSARCGGECRCRFRSHRSLRIAAFRQGAARSSLSPLRPMMAEPSCPVAVGAQPSPTRRALQ